VLESTISHYKILKKLGQGGMGEVYLAEDTRLQRKVAVKVLPTAAASSQESLARFEREAQTAAALNHPNIATIYDVGSETRPDGSHIYYIVEEYLEGQTLQELLRSGRLSRQKALSMAIEIGEGLAAINAAGIVHRDLKPGNIFITSAGHLKILDFGLAKLMRPPRNGPVGENSPTLTFSLTGMVAGQAIGTPGYMAPEQFGESEVDQRADIFAFGTVLYEMLSGHHPFQGKRSRSTSSPRKSIHKSIHSTIHRILNEPPLPLDQLEPGLPLRLQWIVEKCLQKDPAERYQHSSDLLVDLRAASATSAESGPVRKTTVEARMGRKQLALIIALAFFCGIVVSWLMLKSMSQQKVQLPPLLEFDFSYKGQIRPWDGPAISPDGTMVVYRDSGSLWIRDLHALAPRKLEGTEGAGQPFWSPKSDYIAYFTQSQLYKISKAGDSISALCRLPSDLWGGGYWTSSGTIMFGQGPSGIYEVDEQGGEPRQILKPEKGENWLYWPSLLPDSKKLMYVSLKQDDSSEIVIQTGGQRTSVIKRAEFITWAAYSRTGHIVYQMGSSTQRGIASFSIWALPFDAARLARTGEPFQAVSDGMAPTVSLAATLVYRTRPQKENRLVWVDRQGRVLGAIGQPQAVIRNPSISPDGQRVAADGADANGGFDVWIHDPRGTKERITPEFADRRHPVWSPSGDRIAFDSGGSIFVQQLDQSAEARKILPLGAVEEIFLNWSHNGEFLLYDFLSPNRSNRDIWYLRLPVAGKGIPLVQTPADETLPQISPNGRYVLYQSTESGGYLPDIFAVSFPDGKRKTKISISGGTHPRWSPTGNEIFYVDHDDSLVAVSVTGDLQLGQPRRLFTSAEAGTDLSLDALSYVYDVGPKAERFVVVQMPTGGKIAVVQNWPAGFPASK
jgi:eukaryotic-like serine/threonine-protein kinase